MTEISIAEHREHGDLLLHEQMDCKKASRIRYRNVLDE